MLELLTAVVCLIVGVMLGVYMRRNAVLDFQRGVELGLAQAAALLKVLPQPPQQQPRHENRPHQHTPPEKK